MPRRMPHRRLQVFGADLLRNLHYASNRVRSRGFRGPPRAPEGRKSAEQKQEPDLFVLPSLRSAQLALVCSAPQYLGSARSTKSPFAHQWVLDLVFGADLLRNLRLFVVSGPFLGLSGPAVGPGGLKLDRKVWGQMCP